MTGPITDLFLEKIEELATDAANAREARKLTGRKGLGEVTVEAEDLSALCAMARAKIAAEERVLELEQKLGLVTGDVQAAVKAESDLAHQTGRFAFQRARAERAEQERDRLAEAWKPFVEFSDEWQACEPRGLQAHEIAPVVTRHLLKAVTEHKAVLSALSLPEKGRDDG